MTASEFGWNDLHLEQDRMKPYCQTAAITIYHGDSAELCAELTTRFDLVLTDPPYAIGNSRGEWGASAEVAIGLHEAAKLVPRTGSLVAFTTSSGRGIEFTIGAIKRQMPFNRMLTWHKQGGHSRAVSPWTWDTVSVMVFGRAPEGRIGQSSVISTAVPTKSEHPSEIPTDVAEWCYAPFEAEALDVLDPFLGSGRLLEPAVRRGRRVVGIDKDEKWCELAATRLITLANTGESVKARMELRSLGLFEER